MIKFEYRGTVGLSVFFFFLHRSDLAMNGLRFRMVLDGKLFRAQISRWCAWG